MKNYNDRLRAPLSFDDVKGSNNTMKLSETHKRFSKIIIIIKPCSNRVPIILSYRIITRRKPNLYCLR